MLQAELPLTESRYDLAAYEFHRANPGVYREFERRTLEAIRVMGDRRRLIGAKWLWENMRFDFEFVVEGAADYKLNNNHIRWYSLRFEEQHPEFGQVFSRRRAKEEREDLWASKS